MSFPGFPGKAKPALPAPPKSVASMPRVPVMKAAFPKPAVPHVGAMVAKPAASSAAPSFGGLPMPAAYADPAASLALVPVAAPPPPPPPAPAAVPSSSIAWPGGYDAATFLDAGGTAAKKAGQPKQRGPASSTGAPRKNIEKYSSSYTSVALAPNMHIADWLHHVNPTDFTRVFLGRLGRDALLSYLYLATGLVPADRLPSFNKVECLDAMAAEYHRLGQPLQGVSLSPEEVTQYVAAHFASGSGAPTAAAPPLLQPSVVHEAKSSAVAMVPHETASTPPVTPYFYTTFCGDDGEWQLHAFNCSDGQLIQSVPLPNPGPEGYYSVVFAVEHGFCLHAPGQSPVPCADVMVGHDPPPATPTPAPAAAATPSLAIPPGVATFSASLPGMAKHGTGGPPPASPLPLPSAHATEVTTKAETAEEPEEDFSPDADANASSTVAPVATPFLEANPDGSQTLVLGQQCLHLPPESLWALSQNPEGEWIVESPGRTPKTVKGLMKLKRAKESAWNAPMALEGVPFEQYRERDSASTSPRSRSPRRLPCMAASGPPSVAPSQGVDGQPSGGLGFMTPDNRPVPHTPSPPVRGHHGANMMRALDSSIAVTPPNPPRSFRRPSPRTPPELLSDYFRRMILEDESEERKTPASQ